MIEIKKTKDNRYDVTVTEKETTKHEVGLQDSYYQKLTDGQITPEELIKRSFQFLLEREPNTSILREFDLPVIQEYFPEYEDKIRAHGAAG